jgi:integrase
MSTYPAATLNLLKSKKKWYVYVTVPQELRESFAGQVQVRRSTGTNDKKEAERRLHGIAAEIYAEFDSKKPNPKLDWLKVAEKNFQLLRGQEVNWQALPDDKETLNNIVDVVRMKLEAIQALPSDRESAEVVDTLLDKLEVIETVAPSSNLLFPTIVKQYLLDTSFNSKTMKKSASKALEEFSDFLGKKEITSVTSKTIYDWEDYLSRENDYARNTIRGRISVLSGLMNYAVRRGYIATNPAHGLKLTLGKETEHYVPFSKDELHQIFKLPMPSKLRLLFSIAITTGMRIDEIALLTWENIKEEDGIAYFDLTTEFYKVKNKGSARKVPIHPSVSLPERGAGRLFDYNLNQDGKTSMLSAICSRLIRTVTTDERKVFHSLRGNLKDLMRDAGVSKETQDFITGQSSGDVAGKYGQGPSLKTRYEAIAAVEHPWLQDRPVGLAGEPPEAR